MHLMKFMNRPKEDYGATCEVSKSQHGHALAG